MTLDMTTMTIMRVLPREVDPAVFNMVADEPGSIKYSDIGGLSEQIRELREVVRESPLLSGCSNPRVFLLPGC